MGSVEGTEAMSCNVNVDTQVCSAALTRCDCHCVCGDENNALTGFIQASVADDQ